MNGTEILSNQMSDLKVNFLTGAYTRLWESWGEKNISPAYNKFYYLTKGRFMISISGKEYEGRPGQLFLLPSSSLQTYHAYQDDTAEKYWIHCTFSCGERDLTEIVSLSPFVQVDNPEYLASLFREILDCAGSSDLPRVLRQKELLTRLLIYYIEHSDTVPTMIPQEPKILNVIHYIEKSYAEEITLEKLSEIAHFNPRYFIRYFKKNTGLSPMDYVLNLWLNKAKKLLQETGLPVQEIAELSGFKSAYYFSRVFKARIGYPPLRYRYIATVSQRDSRKQVKI